MEQAEILLKEDFDEESKNKDNKKKKLIRVSLILVSINYLKYLFRFSFYHII